MGNHVSYHRHAQRFHGLCNQGDGSGRAWKKPKRLSVRIHTLCICDRESIEGFVYRDIKTEFTMNGSCAYAETTFNSIFEYDTSNCVRWDEPSSELINIKRFTSLR